jgi:osmoprotectant transport system substrate-binding protein
MNRRLLTLAVLLLLVFPLLAACGNEAQAPGEAPGTESTSPPTSSSPVIGATATTAPTTGATAAAPGTESTSLPTGSGPTTEATTTAAPTVGATAAAPTGASTAAATMQATATSGGAGAGATGDKTITIGSKDFTEQLILGELYAQALEAKGYKVNRKLNLGGVAIVDKALTSGQIDMYPEYTGTALETVVKFKGDKLPSPEETYNIVKQFYAKRKPSMTLLKQANFENTYGIFVRKEVADQYNLRTLEDLAKASRNLTFASFGEFQNRADGLPNIKENYPGMNFGKTVLVNDLGLRYRAVQEDKADVGIGFTTDPQLADENLVVMEDPKQIWPPYYPVPIINTRYLQSHPDVEGVINAVSEKLTLDKMREMNRQAVEDQDEPVDIAGAFLEENGLK